MLNNIFITINNNLSYILVVMLVACGLYFSFRTDFTQFRLIPDALKSLTNKSHGQSVSSFQALMISTASRVGAGNISAVVTAIILGGPGAIFWMWVMAIIGASSAFIESTLAQVYKIKNEDGSFRGGPSYYMQKALGKRWLGILFSIVFTICFAYAFNALQSYILSSSFEYYFKDYNNSIYPIILGLILVFFVAIIIFGGTHRIGFITSYLVPIMAMVYMFIGIYVIAKNISMVPHVFSEIINDAFNFKSIFGGFAGSALMVGIKRGLYSNEAGMGSAPNAAASADVSHPVKQGMVQVVSVFIDTIIICSITAFIVLLSGVTRDGSVNGIPLMQIALSSQIGVAGIHFITFCILAFAFSTIIGNYCYAETNVLFIKNNKTVLNLFRVTCLIAVFLGVISGFDTVWNFAEILMALMAILNIIVIFILGDISVRSLKDYKAQKKLGKDPEFNAPSIGLHNTDVWK